MGSHFDNYPYVDGYYEHPKTRRGMPWVRVLARDLDKAVVVPAGNSNCFASVQRFKDATSTRDVAVGNVKKPVMADPALEAAQEEEPDKLPDQQMHYHGLYFDFDCKFEKHGISEEEALDWSRKDAVKVAEFFTSNFDIEEHCVQAWFSGRKGFHLVVRPEVFEIRPHRHLTYILQKVALELVHQFDLQTLDRSVYSIPRMWRIPNTTHADTGRYKIELSLKELKNLPIKEILDLSRVPRRSDRDTTGRPLSHIYAAVEYENISPDPKAVAWWNEYLVLYDTMREMKHNFPARPIVVPEGPAGGQEPVCMVDMLTNGLKPGGPGRNRALLPMVAFFKDAGIDKGEAQRRVREWTQTHFNTDGYEGRQRLANGKSVVDSVYRGANYRFSCRSIRANSGPSAEARVACVGETVCPWIQNPTDQDSADIPLLHLSEASKGCYLDKKVRLPVHVSGIAGHPFGLPVKGEITCTPDQKEGSICEPCPVKPTGGKLVWTFSAEDREVLKVINVTDARKHGAIKAKVRVPVKCFKHELKILEKGNVEEIQIIPMVDYSQVYMEDLTGNTESDITRKAARHVVRRAFHLGHGVVSNKKYIVEASVVEHPEDQRIAFVFDKMEPAQNDIDQFVMTPELLEQLRIFQLAPDQTVADKLKDIHTDFEANVHQIGGRHDLSIGIDLCYHSVIGFKFVGNMENKGWFELLVMGDSGTGKSTMVERMMAHYGLGELLAGEGSSRTGLVYASINMSGQWFVQWGKIPQNDRRLLIIDEFGSIPGEEVSKMTQLRSTGRAQAAGVNASYETFARTRTVLLTNSRTGRALSEFNYGVEAIRDLFDEYQDCRRVDLALVVRSDDVGKDVRNKRWDNSKVDHRYTADLCGKLVLWAWSREPHQVEWATGAEDEVIRWAEILADTYDCDIPIAQPSDLRNKIARISAAVAARLFSTDADAKRVIVHKEHVAYAAQYMDDAYRKPAMAYFEYARMYKNQNNMTAERRNQVRTFILGQADSDNLVAMLQQISYLTRNELGDMTSYEKDDLTKLWKFLIGNQLIKKTARGYRKTPAFTELLKGIANKRSGYGDPVSVKPANGTNGTNGTNGHAKPMEPPPSKSDSDDIIDDGEDPPY